MAKSAMVSTDSKEADKLPSASISEEESVKSTTKPSRGTSTSQKLRLIICELSGVASDAQGFRNKLQTSCVHPGEPKPKRDMPAMWPSGAGMRTADTLIPYRRL